MTHKHRRSPYSRVWLLLAMVWLTCAARAQTSAIPPVIFGESDYSQPWSLRGACRALLAPDSRSKEIPLPVATLDPRLRRAASGEPSLYRITLLFEKALPPEEELVRAELRGNVEERSVAGRFIVIRAPDPVPVEMLKAMRRLKGLQAIQPECSVSTASLSEPGTVVDDAGGELWWRDLISADATQAMDSEKEIVVAIADYGIDLTHPLIAGRLWKNDDCDADNVDDDNNGYIDDCNGWDFVENDNDPSDLVATHALSVAAIVAFVTSCPGCKVKLMPLRVIDTGNHVLPTRLANALIYARANGAKVINASLRATPNIALSAAVEALRPDVLLVAAAGNDAEYDLKIERTHVPAAMVLTEPQVIAIQAVGSPRVTVGEYCQSAFASGIRLLAAPGKKIRICNDEQACAPTFGQTSAAAPFVSAAAALVFSDGRFQSFDTPAKVARLLLDKSSQYSQKKWCVSPNQTFSVLDLAFLQ